MMVKRKLDGTVDESSADQEIRKSDATAHNLQKIWQAGWLTVRQLKFGQGLKF